MNKLIHITIGTLLITSATFSAYGQTSNTANKNVGFVSVSEGELASLTRTLKKYKKTTKIPDAKKQQISDYSNSKGSYEVAYLRNRVTQLEQLLSQTNKGQNNYSSYQTPSNYDQYTRDRLNELTYLMQQMAAKKNEARVIVTAPNALRDIEVVVPSSAPNTENPFTIQQKIDSLYKAIQENKVPEAANYSNDFDALQNKLRELQNEMASKKDAPTDYALLKSKFSKYNKEIYFSNNSKALNTSSNQVIDELVQLLDTNDNIDVVVKGFASDKGNPSYNEKLSMQRTEEVKRNLIIKGIHPTRVLTQYHGIDYKVADAANARRVEISLLVRK